MSVKDLLIESFWRYVDRKGDNECWGWKASLTKHGYGQLSRKGQVRLAHRISYEIFYGKIPKNAFICHKCNNPICANPNHIYAGSPKTNTQDMILAGRLFMIPPRVGKDNNKSKLTEKEVKEIRLKLKNGASCSQLSKIYKVGSVNISAINTGKTWKHIIKNKKELFNVKKGNTKISEKDVLKIRKMKGKHADIAAKYGLCPSTIGKIKNKTLWRHI